MELSGDGACPFSDVQLRIDSESCDRSCGIERHCSVGPEELGRVRKEVRRRARQYANKYRALQSSTNTFSLHPRPLLPTSFPPIPLRCSPVQHSHPLEGREGSAKMLEGREWDRKRRKRCVEDLNGPRIVPVVIQGQHDARRGSAAKSTRTHHCEAAARLQRSTRGAAEGVESRRQLSALLNVSKAEPGEHNKLSLETHFA